jgi:hypothetical protein
MLGKASLNLLKAFITIIYQDFANNPAGSVMLLPLDRYRLSRYESCQVHARYIAKCLSLLWGINSLEPDSVRGSLIIKDLNRISVYDSND